MSFDPFKSSTVGPEALAARLDLEKRLKEQRERDRATRQKDKERREYNLAVAAEDSKNYEAEEKSSFGGIPNFSGPKLSRGNMVASAGENKKFQVASNSPNGQASPPTTKTGNGFSLKRF